MASVRFAIMVGDGQVAVKDPLWVWIDGKAVLMPSVGFESSDPEELQRRVIQEVMATFKAYSERNRKVEKEPVKIVDDEIPVNQNL